MEETRDSPVFIWIIQVRNIDYLWFIIRIHGKKHRFCLIYNKNSWEETIDSLSFIIRIHPKKL